MPQYAFAMVFGALLALYGNQLPDRFWSALLPIPLLLFYYCPKFRFLLLLAATYLWSAALFHYHLDHRLDANHDRQLALVQGVISGIPEIRSGRVSFYLKIESLAGYTAAMPRRAHFNWYQDIVVPGPGERWQFEVKLKQPRGMLNPAGFDIEAWQFMQGIDVSGYVRDSSYNQILEPAAWSSLDRWRGRLAADIDQACDDCQQLGLIKALTLGIRGDISSRQQDLLRTTGTAHLLAISGLHIGMVSMLFYVLGRFCWRLGLHRSGLNRVAVTSLFAIVAAFAYAALAGFSLPTVRALIMFGVFIAALQNRNRISLLQSISVAVMLIVVVDPRAPGTASFWLSFSALLVIAFAGFRLPPRYNWWQQLIALQCLFTLLLVAPGILIFGQLNPASLVANIVAIPVVSFAILPLVLLACLLFLFGLAGSAELIYLADRLLAWLLRFLDLLVDSGLQAVAIDYPAPLLLIALLALLSLVLPTIPGGRRAAMVSLLALVCWQPARLDFGAYELIVLDVGMGTSLLLRTRNHSLVYDLGPGQPGGFNAVDWVLAPNLLRVGVKTPDLLIVSHADQDHSGGLYALRESYDPARLVSGTPQQLAVKFQLDHTVRSCHGFPDWRWDGVDFRFLVAGQQLSGSNDNNRSCVLYIDGYHRTLIPGDIEAVQERRLVLAYGSELRADILLAPHHGSNTSSSQPFLARVNPDQVVFTLAHGNRWGFPRPEVTARYDKLGVLQYRNDLDGAVSLVSSATGLAVSSMRAPHRRIWRRW
jgi:competence protein ComEC